MSWKPARLRAQHADPKDKMIDELIDKGDEDGDLIKRNRERGWRCGAVYTSAGICFCLHLFGYQEAATLVAYWWITNLVMLAVHLWRN